MVNEIGLANSIFNQFLREMRDEKIQTDRMRFRRNMERTGELMAYEISKALDYKTEEVITPLGTAHMRVLEQQPILATILRAGLPFHQGFLNYFDEAHSAFVSAFRMHEKDHGGFKVEVEYLSCPNLEGKQLILVDPMLATGTSMVHVYKALVAKGAPLHTHIACLVATQDGIDHVRMNLPKNTTIWIGAIDDALTAQAYIVPGLGDSGDLSYGRK